MLGRDAGWGWGAGLPLSSRRPTTGPLQLWSLQGERLASLAGTRLPSPAAANNVYVSNSQELLFAYCAPSGDQLGAATSIGAVAGSDTEEEERAAAAAEGPRWWRQRLEAGGAAEEPGGQGSQQGAEESGRVLVFDLLTGRQVAALRPPRTPGGAGKAAAAAAARAALRQCSTLFYCEASRRLYTGSTDGKAHAWAL